MYASDADSLVIGRQSAQLLAVPQLEVFLVQQAEVLEQTEVVPVCLEEVLVLRVEVEPES